MIGQEKLLSKINAYNILTVPKALLFLGEAGCGKKTVASILANNLNLDLVQVPKEITADQILEYQYSPIKTMYLIDLNNFSEKQQNQFLKLIEEPSDTVYIILIANSELGILPTILNRCYKLSFESYSISQLKQIKLYENNLVYDICKTPGQILAFDYNNLDALYALCLKLVHHIPESSYANTLSILTKINLKEDYDKFEFNQFFEVLKYVSYTDFISSKSELSYTIFRATTKALQKLFNKTLNKESFMISFLTSLWKETRR